MATEAAGFPNLIHRYERFLAEGVLRPDPSQIRALERLQQLLEELHQYSQLLAVYDQKRSQYESHIDVHMPRLRHEAEEALAKSRQEPSSNSSSWAALLPFGLGKNNRDAAPEPIKPREVELLAQKKLLDLIGPPPDAPSAPKGVYLHGEVGTGKTLVADLAYQAAVESQLLPHHRRVHFNSTLLELHSRMHALERQEHKATAEGGFDIATERARSAVRARIALRRLARERMSTPAEEYSRALGASNSSIMVRAARALLSSHSAADAGTAEGSSACPALLCLDEVQTNDPYNVAALKALTEATLGDGGVLLATSNNPPTRLTRHGLHEDMFEHWIEVLQGGCDIVEVGSGVDHRRVASTTPTTNVSIRGRKRVALKTFLHPLGPETEAAMAAAWEAACQHEKQHAQAPSETGPLSVPVMFGRTLPVQRYCGGVAWFDFDELCSRALGPADYLALAGAFHTVFLSNVPAMSMRVRDKARRFITLVDEMYNARARLVCSAAVGIDELFMAAGEEGREEPLIDLEQLQFEGAVEGARLRRDVGREGGVAPVAVSGGRMRDLGGAEEAFAFARAVSRLHEMQAAGYGRVLA